MTKLPTIPPQDGHRDHPTQLPTMTSIMALRLAQDHIDTSLGSPVLVSVPVEKPPRAHFFRVRPGDEFSAAFNLLDAAKLGGEGLYAIIPQVACLVADHTRLVQLRLAVTQFDAPYFLPVPLPGPDGRSNPWHLSLARGATLAETRWIRISADMRRGAYTVFDALGHLAEPRWPAESFNDLLEIAFRDRIIESEDHPLIQQLLGKS